MKKSMFLMAVAAMTLVSCSQDEVLDIQKDAISFNVVADKASRGTVIESAADISEFAVYGFSGANVFMEGDNGAGKKITKDEDAWTYSPTQFWPTEASIDFYSVYPAAITMDKTAKTITYTVKDVVSQQEDLLYAVNKGCTKETSGTDGVNVNFRHALSQIVFKAMNTNSTLKVQIDGVKIVKLRNAGTLNLEETTTTNDPDLSDEITGTDRNDQTDTGDTETNTGWGKWTSLSGEATYNAVVTNAVLDKVNEVKDLAVADPMLLLPQHLSPATINANNKLEASKGSYFAISCKVWNVVNGVETLLWPATDEYKDVLIPVSSPDKVKDGNGDEQPGWKQGKKYIYTFKFGEGAGYEPVDPTDPTEPTDPVLVPVSFTVTVDDFQTATVTDVNMDGTN